MTRASHILFLAARYLLPWLALVAAGNVRAGHDWYSAGHGLVETRAFVIQVSEAGAQALLPAPLRLKTDFPGKEPGHHPLLLLFSVVEPKKAHLMPIGIDMPYREVAVFMPWVVHPDLEGDFLHSVVLYLDSRMATWIGQWPYRFPKHYAPMLEMETPTHGRFAVGREPPSLVELDYRIEGSVDPVSVRPQLAQLDAWMSLPLINGTRKFTCSRMDWEITDHASLARVSGEFRALPGWLGDGRALAPFTSPMPGLRLKTLWYLSMPGSCGRYRKK